AGNQQRVRRRALRGRACPCPPSGSTLGRGRSAGGMGSFLKPADRTSKEERPGGAPPAPSGAEGCRQLGLPYRQMAGLPRALQAQRVEWAMRMQRTLGNRATAGLLGVQAKRAVSSSGEPGQRTGQPADQQQEEEADERPVARFGVAPPAPPGL